jgi:gliding motility associated protien GldN
MRKFVVALVMFSFFGANAQVLDPENGPRAWKKENTKQEEPVILTHVREADVMWSKRIWRTVDLRQKQNLPLYYPLQDITLGKRSLIQVIYNVLNDSKGPQIPAYTSYELKDQIPADQVLKMFTVEQEFDSLLFDAASGVCLGTQKNVFRKTFEGEIKEGIVKVHLMEDWFFDKQRSVMDVRILALGIEIPVYNINESQQNCDGTDVIVFNGWKAAGGSQEIWFFFPDLRGAFATHEAYKRANDAARISYDDVFLKRMFASYIFREESVYDREIDKYTKRLEALLEAERISESIRTFEMDMWEY